MLGRSVGATIVECVDDEGVLSWLVMDGWTRVAHVFCEDEAEDIRRSVDEENDGDR
jgi:hypothetical protein